MPVLDADKPKIVFHAAMMCLQNFGFFIMYFALWLATPAAEACAETRFAEGFMALMCFLVAFLCVGMGFGGYIDDDTTCTLAGLDPLGPHPCHPFFACLACSPRA